MIAGLRVYGHTGGTLTVLLLELEGLIGHRFRLLQAYILWTVAFFPLARDSSNAR